MKISNLKNRIVRVGLTLVLIIFSFSYGYATSNSDARDLKKDTLLIFTGSDWCLPCIRLEKNILHDSLFLQFTTYSISFVQADFPQKKKLNEGEVSRNEKLAERFNPNGQFPFLVVIQNGIPTQIPFRDQSTQDLISAIEHIRQGYE